MALSKHPSVKLLNRLRAWADQAQNGKRTVSITYDNVVGYWRVVIADEQGRRFPLAPDYETADWDKLLAEWGDTSRCF